jgi:hypothetical protein
MEISRWQPEMNPQCMLLPTSFTPRSQAVAEEIPETRPKPTRPVELRHA